MTQSMIELKIPAPIRTLGAIVTIEGELPAFGPSGLIYPGWTDDSDDSVWGGENEVVAPNWASGTTYPAGYVAKYAGYVYQAPSPSGISAGTPPAPGTEEGGFYGPESGGGSMALTGAKQHFSVTSNVTVQGATIYGLADFGINSGTKVGIVDPDSTPLDSNNNDDSYVYLAEGVYTGPDGAIGEVHIPFAKPALLVPTVSEYIIIVGDTQPLQNAVFQPAYPLNSPTAPLEDVGANYTGLGRNGNLGGSNASSRLYFRLWTTPWIYLPDAIPAEPRESRFLVYVGATGMDFEAISDDMMTEVSMVDPTYVGPSSFGGTGPGTSRQCFRLKDIIPATPANFQSLYIKYAPTLIPSSGPHGVAVYNVTAEAYVPGYDLGPHSTSARFS